MTVSYHRRSQCVRVVWTLVSIVLFLFCVSSTAPVLNCRVMSYCKILSINVCANVSWWCEIHLLFFSYDRMLVGAHPLSEAPMSRKETCDGPTWEGIMALGLYGWLACV